MKIFFAEDIPLFISLPTSHKVQPSDVVLYVLLNKAFNRECNQYSISHNLQNITPYEVIKPIIDSVGKGVGSFASIGIFPRSPHKFIEDFMVASNTNLR